MGVDGLGVELDRDGLRPLLEDLSFWLIGFGVPRALLPNIKESPAHSD